MTLRQSINTLLSTAWRKNSLRSASKHRYRVTLLGSRSTSLSIDYWEDDDDMYIIIIIKRRK